MRHPPNAAGGAVAGAIAGATGGASLIIDAAAGATGNIVGGVVTRSLDPNATDEPLSIGAVSEDALSGFVGGGAGHVAGEFVHVPEEPTFRFNGRNGRVNNQAYRNGLKALAGRNTRTFVNQGVRAGVTSSGTTHISNSIQDWLTRWWFNQPPTPPQHPHSTVRIFDQNGNQIQ